MGSLAQEAPRKAESVEQGKKEAVVRKHGGEVGWERKLG